VIARLIGGTGPEGRAPASPQFQCKRSWGLVELGPPKTESRNLVEVEPFPSRLAWAEGWRAVGALLSRDSRELVPAEG